MITDQDEEVIGDTQLNEYNAIPTYDIDPSVEYLLKIMKVRGEKEGFVLLDDIDLDGKKVLVKKQIGLPIRKDYRNFIQLYMNEETMKYMMRLKTSTIKLLCYIMDNVDSYGNAIVIAPAIVAKDIDMHYTTVYTARTALLKDKWIYRTDTKDRFTINLLRFSREDVPHVLNMYDRKDIRKKLQDEINLQIEERKTIEDDRQRETETGISDSSHISS